MGTTLGSDFDDDDQPGGSLDLDTGGAHGSHGSSGSSSYASEPQGGVDFDDPFADDAPLGSLELDLPSNSPTAMRSKAPTAPAPPLPPGSLAPPDLALGALGATPSLGHPGLTRPSGTQRAVGAGAAPAPPSSHSQVHSQLGGPPSGPAPVSSHPSLSGALPGGPPSSSKTSQPGVPSSRPFSASGVPAPSSSGIALGAPVPSGRPTAAAVIAKYPPAPEKVWQTPKYAIQVLVRQFELRNDLESLRRRRSPDVALYEAALRAYDAKTFKLGLTLLIAMFTVGTLFFFSPVILRFVNAP